MTGKYTGGNTSLDSALDYYSKMYADAKAKGDVRGMRNANDEANKWRNKYGYAAEYATEDTNSLLQQQGGGSGGLNLGGGGSGGSIGGGSFPIELPDKPGEFEGVNQAAIDKLLDEVLNRDSFAYDPSTDPIYQNYLKQYQREGQRATDDTLARVAAQAGGMNSYAVTAAQQAGDYYAGKAADVIPELYEAAYAKYLDGIEGKVRDLGLLQGMDQTQYNRYRDTMSDWRGDRDFAYGAIRDQVGDQRYEQEWNYQVGRDQIGDQRYEQEWAYQKEQDALDRQYKQDADSFNRAMDRWQVLGYLDEEGARTLGIPAGTQTSDYRFKLASAARSASSGGGGGGTGGKSGSGGGDYDALFKAAMDSGYPKSYIANHYKEHGFTSSSGLYDDFTAWDEGGGSVGEWDGIDKSSVTALGYGPISRAHLEELVDSGEVEMYVDSATGLIKFRKSGKGGAASGPLASMLLP